MSTPHVAGVHGTKISGTGIEATRWEWGACLLGRHGGGGDRGIHGGWGGTKQPAIGGVVGGHHADCSGGASPQICRCGSALLLRSGSTANPQRAQYTQSLPLPHPHTNHTPHPHCADRPSMTPEAMEKAVEGWACAQAGSASPGWAAMSLRGGGARLVAAAAAAVPTAWWCQTPV